MHGSVLHGRSSPVKKGAAGVLLAGPPSSEARMTASGPLHAQTSRSATHTLTSRGVRTRAPWADTSAARRPLLPGEGNTGFIDASTNVPCHCSKAIFLWQYFILGILNYYSIYFRLVLAS